MCIDVIDIKARWAGCPLFFFIIYMQFVMLSRVTIINYLFTYLTRDNAGYRVYIYM